MSNDKTPPNQLSLTVLGRGCLAGFVLAAGFLIISGLAYLLLSVLGLPRNLALLLSILSGPVIGGLGSLLLMVSGRQIPLLNPQPMDDEPDDENLG